MTNLTAKQVTEAAEAITGLKALLAAADDHVSVTAKQAEQITGIKANTFLYWAWKDAQTPPGEPKTGPPSFKVGRRRLWSRTALLEWLDNAQKATGAAS
jgi:hypothetical protein